MVEISFVAEVAFKALIRDSIQNLFSKNIA